MTSKTKLCKTCTKWKEAVGCETPEEAYIYLKLIDKKLDNLKIMMRE